VVPSPGRQHANSSPVQPPSPGQAGNDSTRCSGMTKGDKRCSNRVKAGIPLTYIDGVPEDDVERYCHLHLKVILTPTGVYSRKQKDFWIEFTGEYDVRFSSWTTALTHSQLRKNP